MQQTAWPSAAALGMPYSQRRAWFQLVIADGYQRVFIE